MEWSTVSDAGAGGLVEWSTVSDVRGVCTVHVKAAGSVQLASKTPRMRRIDDGGAASRLIRGINRPRCRYMRHTEFGDAGRPPSMESPVCMTYTDHVR